MSNSKIKNCGFSTKAIHVGQEPDPVTGAVIPSISVSTTFRQVAPGQHTGYEYSRSGNPTRNQFEAAVASLENGLHGIAFASGSAVTACIVMSLPANSTIISVNDVYGGTNRFFKHVAPSLGFNTTMVDMSGENGPKQTALSVSSTTSMVWIESPTNPMLQVVDIARVVEAVRKATQKGQKILIVVDNTFLSPYLQQPLDLGADVVVHSVTKYINGHSDAVLGIAVTSCEDFAKRLRFLQNAVGAVPGPFDAYLAHRGLKTLALRMQRHSENAMCIAIALQSNRGISAVHYPGIASHPGHIVSTMQAKRNSNGEVRGYGGMLAITLVPAEDGGAATAARFLAALQFFTLAESLGGVESLAEVPSVMTHAAVAPEEREKLGITDGLVRLSVGIEDVADLIVDLEQAIAKAIIIKV